jgi:UDP-N-acetylmuramoyl-tripeptide--D-alanyl-D-alanine ligase
LRAPAADGVVAAIERFPGLPMRWERKTLRGITVINDAYNANPVSMRASLDAFAARSQGGAKWVVLGGMLELGDRELAEHRALGEYAARGPWAGLVAVGRLGETIAEAARRAGFPPSQLVCCADAAAAARILGERLRPGDAVLLKASRAVRLERIVRGLS